LQVADRRVGLQPPPGATMGLQKRFALCSRMLNLPKASCLTDSHALRAGGYRGPLSTAMRGPLARPPETL
jgi:hypothetical protein